MTHNDPQMQICCRNAWRMTATPGTWRAGMEHAHNHPQSIQAKGEGVVPAAKGQQKRSVRKQFFIFCKTAYNVSTHFLIEVQENTCSIQFHLHRARSKRQNRA
jgi:hypothetical protein